MNIFLVLHPAGNSSIVESMTWYKNIYKTLQEMGHFVYYLDLREFCSQRKAKFRSKRYKELLSQEIVNIFRKQNEKNPFNLIFTYLTEDDISTDALIEMRKFSIPMMNFSCNNTHQFYLVEKISQYFDYNLYSEKSSKIKFDRVHASSFWFQMAANPKYYYPLSTSKTIDISFIGANYANRAHYIEHLLKQNMNVECYGPGWKDASFNSSLRRKIKQIFYELKIYFNLSNLTEEEMTAWLKKYYLNRALTKTFPSHFKGPVPENELNLIFNKSKINLGFLEVYERDDISSLPLRSHLHLREFEIPMSGGLYITNYSDELAEHYLPDEEVVVYSSYDELIDKIRYLLRKDIEADSIRKKGHTRAKKCHTFKNRFDDLFSKVDL